MPHRFWRWITVFLGMVFMALGVLFLVLPGIGAAIFGLAIFDAGGTYVRAIGLRDLALGIALSVLAFSDARRGVAILLGSCSLIPIGDLILLTFARGGWTLHHLLHLASAVVLVALAIWSLRLSRHWT